MLRAEAERIVPRLREQLGFARFIACGHSVGGAMAIVAAARFPSACVAVLTIGAQAFVEDRTLDGVRRAKTLVEPEELSKLEKHHGERARWIVDAWTDTWLDPAFADWSLDGALARVRCPVLAAHGELDEYGSTEHARCIAAGRGKAIILEGAGHALRPPRASAQRELFPSAAVTPRTLRPHAPSPSRP